MQARVLAMTLCLCLSVTKKTQGPRGGMRRIALSLRHFALSYSVKAVLLNLPPQSSVTTQLCG